MSFSKTAGSAEQVYIRQAHLYNLGILKRGDGYRRIQCLSEVGGFANMIGLWRAHAGRVTK
ncbi:MAG: hypothetical protein WC788_09610 [Candidatus Paceibacterota bacterium]